MKVHQATKTGYVDVPIGGVFDSSYPTSKTRRGRIQGGGRISPTLTSASSENILRIEDMAKQTKRPEGKGWVWDDEKGKWFRVRKLTPRSCFRLMGVTDCDIDKIQAAGISESQQYKMAGNSIVVDVMYHCFENLFFPKEEARTDLTLF